jgi:hypothetical protein
MWCHREALFLRRSDLLLNEEIAAAREKRACLAIAIEPKTGSIQQFAIIANCE